MALPSSRCHLVQRMLMPRPSLVLSFSALPACPDFFAPPTRLLWIPVCSSLVMTFWMKSKIKQNKCNTCARLGDYNTVFQSHWRKWNLTSSLIVVPFPTPGGSSGFSPEPTSSAAVWVSRSGSTSPENVSNPFCSKGFYIQEALIYDYWMSNSNICSIQNQYLRPQTRPSFILLHYIIFCVFFFFQVYQSPFFHPFALVLQQEALLCLVLLWSLDQSWSVLEKVTTIREQQEYLLIVIDSSVFPSASFRYVSTCGLFKILNDLQLRANRVLHDV